MKKYALPLVVALAFPTYAAAQDKVAGEAADKPSAQRSVFHGDFQLRRFSADNIVSEMEQRYGGAGGGDRDYFSGTPGASPDNSNGKRRVANKEFWTRYIADSAFAYADLFTSPDDPACEINPVLKELIDEKGKLAAVLLGERIMILGAMYKLKDWKERSKGEENRPNRFQRFLGKLYPWLVPHSSTAIHAAGIATNVAGGCRDYRRGARGTYFPQPPRHDYGGINTASPRNITVDLQPRAQHR